VRLSPGRRQGRHVASGAVPTELRRRPRCDDRPRGLSGGAFGVRLSPGRRQGRHVRPGAIPTELRRRLRCDDRSRGLSGGAFGVRLSPGRRQGRHVHPGAIHTELPRRLGGDRDATCARARSPPSCRVAWEATGTPRAPWRGPHRAAASSPMRRSVTRRERLRVRRVAVAWEATGTPRAPRRGPHRAAASSPMRRSVVQDGKLITRAPVQGVARGPLLVTCQFTVDLPEGNDHPSSSGPIGCAATPSSAIPRA
jgi:hypothetical protein